MKYLYCSLCQQPGTNLDMHHVSRRSIGNRSNVIPVCRMCHTHIEQNQAWAKEHGFMDRHAEFRSEREFHVDAVAQTPPIETPSTENNGH